MKKKYIKHDRRVVDLSAPGALNLWLTLRVASNGDDINDTAAIKKKYEKKAYKMYGEKLNFSATIGVAKAMLIDGKVNGVAASIFNKMANDIENPMLKYKKS